VCYDTFETQETGDLHILKSAKERMEATPFVCMVTGCTYTGTTRYDLRETWEKKSTKSDSDLEDMNPVVH
jgi:hypothetical protein